MKLKVDRSLRPIKLAASRSWNRVVSSARKIVYRLRKARFRRQYGLSPLINDDDGVNNVCCGEAGDVNNNIDVNYTDVNNNSNVSYTDADVANNNCDVIYSDAGDANNNSNVIYTDAGVADNKSDVIYTDAGVVNNNSNVSYSDAGVANNNSNVIYTDAGVVNNNSDDNVDTTCVADSGVIETLSDTRTNSVNDTLGNMTNSGVEENGNTGSHPSNCDSFINALTREGFMQFSDVSSGRPVLSVAFGFYNEELAAWGSSPEVERRLQSSLDSLPSAERSQYLSAFSRQHPTEAVVDGLPESIWLAWVEPSLPGLANLSQNKHRKSNLSRRKSSMSGIDRCPSSHGDYQVLPFMFQDRRDAPHQLFGNFRLHFAAHARRFLGQGPNELQTFHNVARDRMTATGGRRRMRPRYQPYPQVPALRSQA